MKQSILTYFLLSGVLIICQSCGSSQNRYIPVFHHQPRVSTLGFSISPPPGNNWYEKVNKESLFYLKKIEPKNYFIYTKATELHFKQSFSGADDFLQYVKTQKEINTAPDIYRNARYTFKQSDKSTLCVQYQQQYEDHSLADKQTLASYVYVNVTSNGLICINPGDPDTGIDMFYLERSLPSSAIVSYAEEGEQFLGSLSFSGPVKK